MLIDECIAYQSDCLSAEAYKAQAEAKAARGLTYKWKQSCHARALDCVSEVTLVATTDAGVATWLHLATALDVAA